MDSKNNKLIYNCAPLFFIGGFVNNLIPIITSYLQQNTNISHQGITLIQSSYFLSYLLLCIPSGICIYKIGYKKTIHLALIICFLTSLVPFTLQINNYLFYAPIMLLIGVGLSMLRTALLPLISYSSKIKNYNTSVNTLLAFDTLGSVSGPCFTSLFLHSIFKNHNTKEIYNHTTHNINTLFLVLAFIFFILCIIAYLKKIPQPKGITLTNPKESSLKLIKQKNTILGFLNIFFFIGVEIAIPSFMIGFLHKVNHIPYNIAISCIPIYWVQIFLGRIFIKYIDKKIKIEKLLQHSIMLGCLLSFICIFSPSILSLICILGLGMCNSFMYPSLFAIHTQNIDPKEQYLISSFFLMATSGASFIPAVQAMVADYQGIQESFIIVFLSYIIMYLLNTHHYFSTILHDNNQSQSVHQN